MDARPAQQAVEARDDAGRGRPGKIVARLRWWREDWEPLQPHVRRTALAVRKAGIHTHPILAREPELPIRLWPIFDRYFEIGTEETGRKQLGDMIVLLGPGELDIREPGARQRVRGIWWELASLDAEISSRRAKSGSQAGDQGQGGVEAGSDGFDAADERLAARSGRAGSAAQPPGRTRRLTTPT